MDKEENKEELDSRMTPIDGSGTKMWIPIYEIEVPTKDFRKIYPYFKGSVFHRSKKDDTENHLVRGSKEVIENFLKVFDDINESEDKKE